MGCDILVPIQYGVISEFLLTHPVWDVTLQRGKLEHIIDISTHTSRVGCDISWLLMIQEKQISTHTSRVGCDREETNRLEEKVNFYSHIPCGM